MSEAVSAGSEPHQAGRYTLHGEIASGGMATVYYGRMVGAHGFSRVVAIKRMQPRLARDPRHHAMFVEEARLASRVQHPNVVSILDVVDEHGEVMIVMEYVRGPSLSTLLERSLAGGHKVPVRIIANIGCAMLAGLHAAHEARDRRGRLLGIVHRDVSPQNVLVGIDGTTRIMDFGVAKATQLETDDDGQLTGKINYMAPEQLERAGVDRRTDLFATAVVLWSALAGRRLFRGADLGETMGKIKACEVPPLSEFRDDVPPALEQVLQQALSRARERRPATAEAFASAIEAATTLASTRAVAEWVTGLAGSTVTERDAVIVHIEKTHTAMSVAVGAVDPPPPSVRSDVLTQDWVRKKTMRLVPAQTSPVIVTSARSPRPFVMLAGIGLLALVGVAAGALFFVKSRSSTTAQPAPAITLETSAVLPAPSTSVAPIEESIDAPSATPPAPSASATKVRGPGAIQTAHPQPNPPKPAPSATSNGSARSEYYPLKP